MLRYFLVDKPYDVLSQFTREAPHHRTLADLGEFPPDVYPVGRLDRDSEGLLLLTNDKRLNAALLRPRRKQPKVYWAQVEGKVGAAQLRQLASGVTIRIKGREHHCSPAAARRIPVTLPDRHPPIRYRASIPTDWLELTLTEGKNRQVRRMCAVIGTPVLRLVRHAVAGVSREDLDGKVVREVAAEWLIPRLGLRL